MTLLWLRYWRLHCATEAAGPFYHVLMLIDVVSSGFPAVDLPLLSMMGGMQLPCCYVAQGGTLVPKQAVGCAEMGLGFTNLVIDWRDR